MTTSATPTIAIATTLRPEKESRRQHAVGKEKKEKALSSKYLHGDIIRKLFEKKSCIIKQPN